MRGSSLGQKTDSNASSQPPDLLALSIVTLHRQCRRSHEDDYPNSLPAPNDATGLPSSEK